MISLKGLIKKGKLPLLATMNLGSGYSFDVYSSPECKDTDLVLVYAYNHEPKHCRAVNYVEMFGELWIPYYRMYFPRTAFNWLVVSNK